MDQDPGHLIAEAVGAGILWIVYTVMVLVMVKIQKMNVSALGALVSCFLGVAATFIPYVGIYVSFPVVVFCLWRFAGPHAFGDAIFTVVISGALMFCFKLWVLGALMGDLSGHLDAFLPAEQKVEEVHAAEPDPTPTDLPIDPGFDWTGIDPDAFILKGITTGKSQSLIMFDYGGLIYTLETGESCAVKTDRGHIRVRFIKLQGSEVELLLEEEESLILSVD